MRILAIETSCDETAIAILECSGDAQSAEFKVFGNALLSQIELHQPYGGVFPSLAKREHIKNLPVMLHEALNEAKLSVADVDAIAVTAGPGLEPALWTGIEFAKNLAQEFQKPLLAVNHMEGHILAALAARSTAVGSEQGAVLKIADVHMPVLALLISGGHTELVLMKNWLEYELIGQTVDDAVGEAFDKVARMMNLPYPGGPEISKLAEERRSEGERRRENSLAEPASFEGLQKGGRGDPRTFSQATFSDAHKISLPRPMIHDHTCNFSFAGLKTAVLYALKNMELTDEKKKEVALEFENAVGEVLWKKTAKALEATGAKTLVIGGGVSANTHIRREFTENIKEYSDVSLRIPSAALTTDNAIMIAMAGYFRSLRKEYSQPFDKLRACGNLSLAKP